MNYFTLVVLHAVMVYSQGVNLCLPVSQQLTKQNCVINYQVCSDSLSLLNFTSCPLTYCKQYQQDIQSNQYYCVDWGTQFLEENICLNTCCAIQSTNNLLLTSQIMNTCIKYNQKESAIVFYIVTGVFSGLFFIVILVIYQYKRRKSNKEKYASIQQLYRLKTNKLSLNLTQTCSICLDQKTNCITLCGHSYHFQCIGAWINRRQECPNCKTDKIHPINIFCEICSKQFYRESRNVLNILTHQEKNGRIVCSQCKQKLSQVDLQNNLNGTNDNLQQMNNSSQKIQSKKLPQRRYLNNDNLNY